ncbi:hypothetical protein EV198_1754 [Roseivirga ehrenbergii]|uniref:Uncharacterized protein n=1 Tax=Roseivirga ehrenbergii (strain DSM 102268 / JCM 13514 / KCTC 12282 / NCIMB 14502 / KMM 6017) TaxID=279360 RepID=A0A150XS97_ROSEK|nr:hypothetical protein [Roseivirga ehrenbergii]KYG81556.1 hypothetical protein MB14_13300 [Roseivirga ehrenbergii]TCL10722.1 hypothetical protein EV198_1754 [Roseivirga ehrenbergii]
MKKAFIKYLLLIVLLNGVAFTVLLFTAWDDGNPEGVNPVNNGMIFILKYVLGAPTGFFFKGDFDMILLLLIPVNSTLQFFGYRYLLTKTRK